MADKEDVKLAVSDFNLQSISTTEYSEILTGTIQSGSNLAIFGRRGSGKTEIAKQTILSTEMVDEHAGKTPQEVYINLSVAERTDMGGYPDMFGTMEEKLSDSEKRERFVKFILPKFYQPLIVGSQPIVVVFDEVDKADPSIWAPLLEILQYKSINHRPLPNLQSCILTGNLISEGSQRPSLPLLDRAEKYLLKADPDSFLAWAARSNKIHPSIRVFLRDKPGHLYGSDEVGDLYADKSPRGWEYASRALFFGEKHKWSKELMNKKVAGFVGQQAGIEYQIYFEHYRELLPLVDSVFKGENVVAEYKAKDPSMQIYAAMIICSRLAGILDKVPCNVDNEPLFVPDELRYVGHFMQKAVSEENVLVAVRTQITIRRVVIWGLDSNKDWGNILIDVTDSVAA